MKKLVNSVIAICFSICSLSSQNRIISGRVVAEDLEAIPSAIIYINDTIEAGKTDLKGFFQIEIPVSVNKMTFTFPGMETTKIELSDSCGIVEMVMMSSRIYDFKTLKKVDRLRMRRFKKISQLHREAFAKGIFKTGNSCYKQDFVYSYKRKQNLN